MGNTQSFDQRHVRIWSNLCALEDDSSRLKMLEVLFSSPEHVVAAKSAGLYSALLQWVSAIRRGQYAPWPILQQQQSQQLPVRKPQQQQQPQQLARIPPPKRALDTLYEAYRVLELDDSTPLSHEALRQAYRKAGFRTHPDRGGSPEAFDEVSRAFEYLQQVLDKLLPKTAKDGTDPRFSTPITAESAAQYRNTFTRGAPKAPVTPGVLEIEGEVQDTAPQVALNPKKLDMAVFNKLFEENRLPDPDKDDGYGDWLKIHETSGILGTINMRGKYNKDMFNKTFEEEARRISQESALQKFTPPSELTLAPKMGVELGKGRPEQYTSAAGKGSIGYTDLKHAYGRGSTFTQEVANVDLSDRPQTFEQAKREHAQAPNPMTPEQLAAVAAFDAAKKQAEEQRQRRAAAQDVDTQAHYERIQRRLLIKQ
jgi:curved DNA-binding protein CbpA